MHNPFNVTGSRTSSRPKQLEWEESALDRHSDVEGFFDDSRNTPYLLWLKGIVVCLLAILSVKLFSLQVLKGTQYRALAEGNRIRKQVVLAPRGIIYDHYGKVLAQNTVSFNLVAVPFDLPKEGVAEEIAKLAELFHIDPQETKLTVNKLNRASYDPVVVKPDLSQEETILFATRASEFAGFTIQTVPIRDYPSAPIFSHILGYTSNISEEELAQRKGENYYHGDYIGKTGVELVYEQYLKGQNGQNLIEVDAGGRLVKVLGKVDPVSGNTTKLTIDRELQEEVYRNFEGKALGAAVVMNPKTGAVLALVSIPGFDNNLFAHGISAADYSALLSDKHLPLFNRAIAGVYPPGSTVKPMVGLAALEENTVTEKSIIVDRGVLVIPNQYDPSIAYNFYGWKHSGLGPLNIYGAIARSSDIYFYTVAGGHPDSPHIKGLGADRLNHYFSNFNIGRPTGIDLIGEKPGVLPTPEWKANYFKGDAILSKWYLGDTYHIGIGQGFMLATPLQMAEWTSVIANNGIGMKPRLLDEVTEPGGRTLLRKQPEVLIQKFASDKNIKIIQEAMHQTVLYGSARQLNTLPISAAGKTGTSQFDGADPTRTHAWFTSYAPFADPEVVVTVLVEAGGEGHIAAEPIAKNILQWWADHRYTGPRNQSHIKPAN